MTCGAAKPADGHAPARAAQKRFIEKIRRPLPRAHALFSWYNYARKTDRLASLAGCMSSPMEMSDFVVMIDAANPAPAKRGAREKHAALETYLGGLGKCACGLSSWPL
jgi:hypothetical protein